MGLSCADSEIFVMTTTTMYLGMFAWRSQKVIFINNYYNDNTWHHSIDIYLSSTVFYVLCMHYVLYYIYIYIYIYICI